MWIAGGLLISTAADLLLFHPVVYPESELVGIVLFFMKLLVLAYAAAAPLALIAATAIWRREQARAKARRRNA